MVKRGGRCEGIVWVDEKKGRRGGNGQKLFFNRYVPFFFFFDKNKNKSWTVRKGWAVTVTWYGTVWSNGFGELSIGEGISSSPSPPS